MSDEMNTEERIEWHGNEAFFQENKLWLQLYSAEDSQSMPIYGVVSLTDEQKTLMLAGGLTFQNAFKIGKNVRVMRGRSALLWSLIPDLRQIPDSCIPPKKESCESLLKRATEHKPTRQVTLPRGSVKRVLRLLAANLSRDVDKGHTNVYRGHEHDEKLHAAITELLELGGAK